MIWELNPVVPSVYLLYTFCIPSVLQNVEELYGIVKYQSWYLFMPSVHDNELGGLLQIRGSEFGVTTGRQHKAR